MNLPSERFQVDVQKYECHQFEQLLDDCLDGRDSISALASNAHLQQCDDCQNAYDVYLQFDSAGGAVLNGGARSGGTPNKLQRDRRDRSGVRSVWSVLRAKGAAVLTTSAAALLIFVLALPPQGSDSGDVSNVAALNGAAINSAALTGLSPIDPVEGEDSFAAEKPREFALWDAEYISDFRSAIGDEATPALNMLLESSDFSSSLVASQLAIPLQRVMPPDAHRPFG